MFVFVVKLDPFPVYIWKVSKYVCKVASCKVHYKIPRQQPEDFVVMAVRAVEAAEPGDFS